MHELPLDAIKIDRRFIARLSRVETTEQLAFVRGLGCEYAQGYLFSHPLPA